jgi:hypothetical protein
MTTLSRVCAEYFRARQSEPSCSIRFQDQPAVDRADVRSIRDRGRSHPQRTGKSLKAVIKAQMLMMRDQ